MGQLRIVPRSPGMMFKGPLVYLMRDRGQSSDNLPPEPGKTSTSSPDESTPSGGQSSVPPHPNKPPQL